jgi:hypothetical protein
MYYSLHIDSEESVRLGQKIRYFYENREKFNTSSLSPSQTIVNFNKYVGKLMEGPGGKSILEYCEGDLADIPEHVLIRLHRYKLCPDNESKESALVSHY